MSDEMTRLVNRARRDLKAELLRDRMAKTRGAVTLTRAEFKKLQKELAKHGLRLVAAAHKELCCPLCGSKNIVSRMRDKTRSCRRCGARWTYEAGEPQEAR